MNIKDMKNSKFLSSADCREKPLLLTMGNVTHENVAMEGAEPELKWCLSFKEVDKPLVLNRINIEIIAQFTGQVETDNWNGKQVVLYFDPNVSFGGKLTGGLRVRAPKQQPAKAAAAPGAPSPTPAPAPEPEQMPVEDDSDGVPF